MKTRYEALLKELSKSSTDNKEIIIAWMSSAYECGLKDAGDILGEKLSEEINKNFVKSKNGEKRE